MTDKKYILFIDSGIGGLSILSTFLAKKSNVNVIYYADVKNFPYGIKSEDELGDILCNIYHSVSQKYQIAMIVIACNTASVSALQLLRSKIQNIPIIGTVPAIKTAARITKNGHIGVVATETTLSLDYVDNLIKQFASDKQVFTHPSRRLVEAAELYYHSPECDTIIKEEMKPFKEQNIDTLVLGCTHYSFLFDKIKAYFENTVQVVDSRDGVSNRIISLLPPGMECDEFHHLLVLSKNDEEILDKYKDFNKMLSLFNEIIPLEIEK